LSYKSVNSSFWTDPKMRELTIKQRYFYLYLITNSHAHYSGIYHLPMVFAIFETDLSADEVSEYFDLFKRLKLIKYDEQYSIIWIIKMAKYQLGNQKKDKKTKKNDKKKPKVVTGVENHLKELHNCPLIKEFLEFYKEYEIAYRYPIDICISISNSKTITNSSGDNNSVSKLNELLPANDWDIWVVRTKKDHNAKKVDSVIRHVYTKFCGLNHFESVVALRAYISKILETSSDQEFLSCGDITEDFWEKRKAKQEQK